jgi:type I restriction enzyme M protein
MMQIIIKNYLELSAKKTELKRVTKEADEQLDDLCYKKYPKLSEAEIKTLVVDNKWLATLSTRTHGEMDRVSQNLTQRIKELAERYAAPLPQLTHQVSGLEQKVYRHLEKMGFVITH